MPTYTLALWKLIIPPRAHIFLWLLANNRMLTRNNLAKSRKVDDVTCLFFLTKPEYVQHLFFDRVVAKAILHITFELMGTKTRQDFESVGYF